MRDVADKPRYVFEMQRPFDNPLDVESPTAFPAGSVVETW